MSKEELQARYHVIFQQLCVEMEARRGPFEGEGFRSFWTRWVEPVIANCPHYASNVEAGALMHHLQPNSEKPFVEMTADQVHKCANATRREVVKLMGLFAQFPSPPSGGSRGEQLQAFRVRLFREHFVTAGSIQLEEEDLENKMKTVGQYDASSIYWLAFVLFGQDGALDFGTSLGCTNPSNDNEDNAAASRSQERFVSRSAGRRVQVESEQKRQKDESNVMARSLLTAVEDATKKSQASAVFSNTAASIVMLKEMLEEETCEVEKQKLREQLKELRMAALRINAMQRAEVLFVPQAPLRAVEEEKAAAVGPRVEHKEVKRTVAKKSAVKRNVDGQALNKDGTLRKPRSKKSASPAAALTPTTTTTTTTIATASRAQQPEKEEDEEEEE